MQKLQTVIDKATPDVINNAMRSNLKGVVRWSTAATVYNGSAGGRVVVQHDLGVVPNEISVTPMLDSRWWVDSSDRATWSSSAIAFHASATGQFVIKAGRQ